MEYKYRKNGARKNGVRKNGVRKNGVRKNGVEKTGSGFAYCGYLIFDMLHSLMH